MSGLFRSEAMQFVRLTIPSDSSYDTVRKLGELGKFHMIDLMEDQVSQSDHYLYYKKRVVDCAYWERKLERLEQEMVNNRVPVPGPEIEAHDLKVADVVVEVQNVLQQVEGDLNRNLEFKASETKVLNETIERRHVLEKTRDIVRDLPGRGGRPKARSQVELDDYNRGIEELKRPFLEEKGAPKPEQKAEGGSRFHNYLCGVIPVQQQSLFERMLFRVSRGNAYVRFLEIGQPLMDPTTNQMVDKSVFYVVYIGETLERRITKMADYFRATRYNIPETQQEYDEDLNRLMQVIVEKRQVLDRTQHDIMGTLGALAFDSVDKTSSPLRNMQEALRIEKTVCDAMKKCRDVDGKRQGNGDVHAPPARNEKKSTMIHCEGWVPQENVEDVRACLYSAVEHTGAQPAVMQTLSVNSAPPTYFKLNKVTAVFQGIVDTYGVPRYQEVNPGLFTTVTFPFLFGVMYGDIGHGICLTFASFLMVWFEDKLLLMKKRKTLGEIPSMMFGGRYLLLAMGVFAVYCGFVYNDCFSIPINLFHSKWNFPENGTDALYPPEDIVYPIGIDPSWYNTKNELLFFNSLKMKMSVTLGVIQMTFGICLQVFNHLYFKDYLSIFFEFIPQLIFMLCTFGYMVFIIILKFCIDWTDKTANPTPPNLIQTMINMFLSPGSVKAEDQLYSGQGGFQAALVLMAVFSVPWMLFFKPFILKHRHQQGSDSHMPLDESDVDDQKEQELHASVPSDRDMDQRESGSQGEARGATHGGGGGHGHGDHFDFSEIFIHQAIHTIEFVLGCVSNTASYLRLWALSLAHAELSNVFWEKLIMQYGVKNNALFAFVGWGAWAGATFAVLLAMDVLECFLHALRLHWVEFQNKFFHADGYAFKPFTFEKKEEDD